MRSSVWTGVHDRDRHLTPVYKGIRTRRRAEQVARRCADQGVSDTITKFHIPIETKQNRCEGVMILRPRLTSNLLAQ
jgi:hypothetical protein